MNVGKLLETVNSLVPLNYAFDDDFVGLTVGSEDSKVNGVAVAHEIENSILDYSTNNNINTLITYHPPPLKKILKDDGTETFEDDLLTAKCRELGLNIITIHTAQDVCNGGNADSLVDLFSSFYTSEVEKTKTNKLIKGFGVVVFACAIGITFYTIKENYDGNNITQSISVEKDKPKKIEKQKKEVKKKIEKKQQQKEEQKQVKKPELKKEKSPSQVTELVLPNLNIKTETV